jgi:hypothetical protein
MDRKTVKPGYQGQAGSKDLGSELSLTGIRRTSKEWKCSKRQYMR